MYHKILYHMVRAQSRIDSNVVVIERRKQWRTRL